MAAKHCELMSTDIERDAGSLFVVGFLGDDISSDLATAITEGRVGGVILFTRNFSDVAACRDLCRRLRALSPELLIAIDQEGGRVQRLRDPFPELPPMRRFGSSGRPELARRAAELVAAALRDVGVHQNYAPVLDVDSNPANPVIGDRAFARDPETVARFGAAWAEGLERGGVAACGKHFPGHGDTERDSHEELPRVAATPDLLRARELSPFAALAATSLPAIMTAHVLFPGLDPDAPATFSRRIVEGELRARMGFRGVVVSDDLEMGAVDRSIPEAAVAAVEAGCDQLLVCSRPADAEAARRALVQAVHDGALPAERVRQAAARVRHLQARYVGPPQPANFDALRRERDAVVAALDVGAV